MALRSIIHFASVPAFLIVAAYFSGSWNPITVDPSFR